MLTGGKFWVWGPADSGANAYNLRVNIVLYEPDIPWNTGNIGRTCVATDTTLHLVGKLGFSLEDKEVRRSGLDYWQHLRLVQHADWSSFVRSLPDAAPLYLFSKFGEKDFWEADF